jgi:hypothetical protein
VTLQGGFNTVVLGNGNDAIDVGTGTGSVVIGRTRSRSPMRASSARPLWGHTCSELFGGSNNVGFFDGGSGNVGSFDGLGNPSPTSGNGNVGVFDGLGNGGLNDGNGNVGAFDGNLNGVGDTSRTDGAWNGNGNVGVLDGNCNGSFAAGTNSGNSDGDGNLDLYNGNSNGSGAVPARCCASAPCGWQRWSVGSTRSSLATGTTASPLVINKYCQYYSYTHLKSSSAAGFCGR